MANFRWLARIWSATILFIIESFDLGTVFFIYFSNRNFALTISWLTLLRTMMLANGFVYTFIQTTRLAYLPFSNLEEWNENCDFAMRGFALLLCLPLLLLHYTRSMWQVDVFPYVAYLNLLDIM